MNYQSCVINGNIIENRDGEYYFNGRNIKTGKLKMSRKIFQFIYQVFIIWLAVAIGYVLGEIKFIDMLKAIL